VQRLIRLTLVTGLTGWARVRCASEAGAAEAIVGMDYAAVSMTIKRFEDSAKQDTSVQALMDSVGAKSER
jgi:hypothetical protein